MDELGGITGPLECLQAFATTLVSLHMIHTDCKITNFL